MVPGSIPSIDLDTHGGEKNCSEKTGYPVSQGSAPGDQGALTIKGAFYCQGPLVTRSTTLTHRISCLLRTVLFASVGVQVDARDRTWDHELRYPSDTTPLPTELVAQLVVGWCHLGT